MPSHKLIISPAKQTLSAKQFKTWINGIISPRIRGHIPPLLSTVHQMSSSTASTAESKASLLLRLSKALRIKGCCCKVSHETPRALVKISHCAKACRTFCSTAAPECDKAPCSADNAASKTPVISCSACRLRSGRTAVLELITSCKIACQSWPAKEA